jgi:cobalt-zinc-cadmium efflux system protein
MYLHHLKTRESRRSLKIALGITSAWFAVELAAGFYTNSLALLADAAHMLTDVAALALSLFALVVSARPATHAKTYGYLRVEILAALANGIFLAAISGYIFYEAFQRMTAPPAVRSATMLAVSSLGLAANLAAVSVLYSSQHESLNLRGAFLHVVGDTLGSLGAIVAGIAMVGWQYYLADPIASVLVSVIVLYGAWRLVRESVDVLIEATPPHLNIASILADLGAVPGVASVHDLHVWSITSGLPAMSCHVVLRAGVDSLEALRALSGIMRRKYSVDHTTIQIEVEQEGAAVVHVC